MRAGFLCALLVTYMLALGSDAVAMPRDVYFEKTYCTTERGRRVKVESSNDHVIPQVERHLDRLVIKLNFEALRNFRTSTARFLFTRACVEASAMEAGGWTGNLECQTLKFIAQRYKVGFEEVNEIIEDLRNSSAAKFALRLNDC